MATPSAISILVDMGQELQINTLLLHSLVAGGVSLKVSNVGFAKLHFLYHMVSRKAIHST